MQILFSIYPTVYNAYKVDSHKLSETDFLSSRKRCAISSGIGTRAQVARQHGILASDEYTEYMELSAPRLQHSAKGSLGKGLTRQRGHTANRVTQ